MRLVVSGVVTCYIGVRFMTWAWLKIGNWWAGWRYRALSRLFLLRFLVRVDRSERLTAAVLELHVNRTRHCGIWRRLWDSSTYLNYYMQEWFDVENVFVGGVRFKVDEEHGKSSFCLVMFYICDLPSWETNFLNCRRDISD